MSNKAHSPKRPRNHQFFSANGSRAPMRLLLLASTILGTGALLVTPETVRADPSTGETINQTTPITTSGAGIASVNFTDTGDLSVTTSATVTSTDNAGIVGIRGDGSITFTLDGDTNGVTNGAYAESTSGSVTVGGSGAITSSDFANDGQAGEGIYAKSGTGSVTISGTGSTSSAGKGIYALISYSPTASSDILINRSGAISAGGPGVFAENTGSGKITIQGIGAVTAGSYAIRSSAQSGATLIDLTKNVTVPSGNAVYATSTTGDITVKTATGVALTSGAESVYASSFAGGNIDIGGAAGLGGAVSGAYGIVASTNGAGTINVKTASGGTVTASNGTGIQTTAVDGATMIDLASSVSSSTNTSANSYAVSATATGTGNITVKTAQGGAINANATMGNKNGYGIYATSEGGTVDIGGATGLGGAITAEGRRAFGVYGYSAGNVTIKTASGADINVSAKGTSGTRAASGVVGNTKGTNAAVNITLGANVTATDAGTGSNSTDEIIGVSAQTTGGTVNITTMAGVAVTGKTAIKIGDSRSGAQTINVGVGSTITGSNYAIDAASSQGGDSSNGFIKGGDATVNNAGIVKGSIRFNPGNAAPEFQGVGTFNNSGTLALVGSQSNTGFALNNLSGGTLTGTGSFGAVNAASGSTIQAGDRAGAVGGTFTMSNLTMASGATLDVRVDAASGKTDKANVTGTATLNGGILNVTATPDDKTPDYKTTWATPISTKQKYTVLTAGTLTGTFDKVTTDLAFLKVKADYSTANQVDVTFARNGVDYTSVAKTDNQTNVAQVLKAASDSSSLTTKGQALIEKIDGTVKQGNETKALDALSGSQTPVLQTSALQGSNRLASVIGNQALGALNGPGAAISTSGALAYVDDGLMQMAAVKATTPKDKEKAKDKNKAQPLAEHTWRVWATALGSVNETSANSNNPRVTGSDVGGAVGFDKIVAPGLIAGFAFGGTNSTSSVDSGATKGNVDGGHVSVYGIAESGPLYVSASLGYGRYSAQSTRTVTGIGSTETWKGDYGANGYSGDIEVGYRYKVGAYQITPFAGLRSNVIDQDAYSEKSDDPAAVFGLSYEKKQTRSLPASLGVQVESDFGTQNGWQITGLSRVAFVHDFDTSRSVTASFVNIPGNSFTTTNANSDDNAGRLSAGLTLVNAKGSTLFATLTGDFSQNARAGTLQAGYKYQW